jgi:hypothetical protein
MGCTWEGAIGALQLFDTHALDFEEVAHIAELADQFVVVIFILVLVVF